MNCLLIGSSYVALDTALIFAFLGNGNSPFLSGPQREKNIAHALLKFISARRGKDFRYNYVVARMINGPAQE
jgi:hypothetical protein